MVLAVMAIAVGAGCAEVLDKRRVFHAEDVACSASGTWWDPAARSTVAHDRLIEDMTRRPVVLLGERHDAAEDHRWQLATLAALHGRDSDLVIGFEMFPRRLQPVLDRWVQGQLSADDFLTEAEWERVWGFPADLYLPLFHFARQHRVPMIALNVDRALVSRVAREGWAAVPPTAREGVSDPATPPAAYTAWLAAVFQQKTSHSGHGSAAAAIPQNALAAVGAEPGFRRFVEAQSTWDRAMAEAIAAARSGLGNPRVVAIVGRGHAKYGWGIPHQLADLGIANAAVLLPEDAADDCSDIDPDIADAVFVVDSSFAKDSSGP